MPLNKFGQSRNASKQSSFLSKFQSTNLLKFTPDGNIDVEHLKICNVKQPSHDTDAVNKKYVDLEVKTLSDNVTKINNEIKKSISDSNLLINRLNLSLHKVEQGLNLYITKFDKQLAHFTAAVEEVNNKVMVATDKISQQKEIINTLALEVDNKNKSNKNMIDEKWGQLMNDNEVLSRRIKILEDKKSVEVKRQSVKNSFPNIKLDDVKRVRLTPCPEGTMLDKKNGVCREYYD